MTAFKPRERREPIRLSVRLRVASGWYNARVENVSLQGMGLQSKYPPPSGSHVEIRRGTYTVTGRIIWSKEGRFGIRAEDEIALSELTKEIVDAPVLNDRRKSPRREIELVPEPVPARVEIEAVVRSGNLRRWATALAVVGSLSLLFYEMIFGALKEVPAALVQGLN